MILDKLLRLAEAQAISGTTATVSTNTIDLGNSTVKRDIGVGEALVLLIHIAVALGGTTPTALFEFIQSANADLSSPDVLATSGTISGAANAPAGAQFELPIPQGRITKRYIGVRVTLGGTSPTITYSAELQPASMASRPLPTNYAKGYAI
jgi:hypothetical protein